MFANHYHHERCVVVLPQRGQGDTVFENLPVLASEKRML
jgi:hypothetical protein